MPRECPGLFIRMTEIGMTFLGLSFDAHSPLSWDECMNVMNRHFGGPDIGGPEMPQQDANASVGQTTGRKRR